VEFVISRTLQKHESPAQFSVRAIKVLGTGCANCRATAQRVEEVAKELGVPITLEKVEAIQDIMGYGIVATPGIVVDGKVVHSGGGPAREKIAGWLGPGAEPVTGAVPITSGCGCVVAGDARPVRARWSTRWDFHCGSFREKQCGSPPLFVRR
jgi:small redox-active disulfide protein 2